jgi:Spy/CpxP family protein refolding chaperone
VPWWRSPDTQRQLALSRAQVNALERIFRATHRQRLALSEALARAEREFARAVEADDESLAVAAAERVRKARVARNTERMMMLVRMYRVLTPRQRQLVDILPRRRGSPPESIPLLTR